MESQLGPEDLDTLRNPQPHSSTPSNNPDLVLSVSNYMDLMTSSQEAYDKIAQNIRRRDPTIDVLSYDRVRRATQKLSGVIALRRAAMYLRFRRKAYHSGIRTTTGSFSALSFSSWSWQTLSGWPNSQVLLVTMVVKGADYSVTS